MKKIFLIILCFYSIQATQAQIPWGYYTTANGIAGGGTLQSALHFIIKNNHVALGYSSTWNAFQYTDKKPNGKLWDIYSYVFTGNQPYEYTIGASQCGSYSKEGDCYNREHTWPQSYFASSEPMVSDLHQLLPTDGFINGIHSNDPYGNVASANKTTANGSKNGTSNSYPGYFNNVFEPIDSFKGDIARCYFYMCTRYYGEDFGWSNWPMANGASLTPAAIAVLLAWHHLDPVSKKEKDRNNAVYAQQGNRNPFIDEPLWADCIWGTSTCTSVNTPIDVVVAKEKFQFTKKANAYLLENNSGVSSKFLLVNCVGAIVNQNTFSTKVEINTDTLPAGMYCLLVWNKEGKKVFQFLQ